MVQGGQKNSKGAAAPYFPHLWHKVWSPYTILPLAAGRFSQIITHIIYN